MEELSQIPRRKRILLASDFDGTLAPIVEKASEARILPAARDAMGRLASIPGLDLAIVSGRNMMELGHLCENLPPRWMAAGHGSSILGPDGNLIELAGSATSAAILPLLQSEAMELAKRHPKIDLERKDTGIALHYRSLAAEEVPSILPSIESWSERARLSGFEVLHGRLVVEIVPPGASKLKAIQAIAKKVLPDFVIFAGDDITDLESIRILSASDTGFGVWIRSAERGLPPFQPDLSLDGPEDWARFLGSLATHLEEPL